MRWRGRRYRSQLMDRYQALQLYFHLDNSANNIERNTEIKYIAFLGTSSVLVVFFVFRDELFNWRVDYEAQGASISRVRGQGGETIVESRFWTSPEWTFSLRFMYVWDWFFCMHTSVQTFDYIQYKTFLYGILYLEKLDGTPRQHLKLSQNCTQF